MNTAIMIVGGGLALGVIYLALRPPPPPPVMSPGAPAGASNDILSSLVSGGISGLIAGLRTPTPAAPAAPRTGSYLGEATPYTGRS